MRDLLVTCAATATLAAAVGCGPGNGPEGIDRGLLRAFEPLPAVIDSPANPVTPGKVALGRRLFLDPRLSASGGISCNTCHPLDRYGADGKRVSEGHDGAPGRRNSPTVYNAAGHFAQFWDGRAATVEEQAAGPLLASDEMAMSSPEAVEAVIREDAEYRRMFAVAFPGEAAPETLENTGRAIGAFERTLVTPSRWDDFLRGDNGALTGEERTGFERFNATGCMTCHRGAYVGGEMYSRLGIVKAWPDQRDLGRYEVTRNQRDRMVFKVPSLRNAAMTAPYLHDGSVESLDATVRLMAEYQLGKQLTDEDARLIVTWLWALTGTLPDHR